MSTTTAWPRRSWLGRSEDWLDDRGRPAWIAAIVLGFVVFWPVGLAILAYAIWSKRMFSRHTCGARWDRSDRRHDHPARGFGGFGHQTGYRSSGNAAFDAYKSDTLDRLEREQTEFETFLKRLRDSKDKAEFDQYMDERARAARADDAGPSPRTDDDTPPEGGRDPGPGRY